MNAEIWGKFLKEVTKQANSNPDYYLGHPDAYLTEKQVGMLLTDSMMFQHVCEKPEDHKAIEAIEAAIEKKKLDKLRRELGL